MPSGALCSCGAVVAVVAESAAPRPDALRVPGYRIDDVLGRGGVGTVWQATRVADGHGVALKVSHGRDETVRARFAREADALRTIGPPFVPELHQAGALEDGRSYLVMEKLAGSTLEATLERSSAPLPIAQIQGLVSGLSSSLAAAHRAGIVHRDLKPANIFVTPRRVTLLDFGLVRPMSAARDPANGLAKDKGRNSINAEPTHTGVAVGTLGYMAPEQLSGSRRIDGRADIYSMGVILFELFTRRRPFVGDPGFVEYAHLVIRPPRPSSLATVPRRLEDVILRCLAKEPGQRYRDVAELDAALDDGWRDAAAAPAGAAEGSAEATRAGGPAPGVGLAAEGKTRSKRRKETGIVVFVSGVENVADLRRALESHGGQLGHMMRNGRAACVFTHDVSRRPVRRALEAAQRLLGAGGDARLVDRALIDLVPMVLDDRGRGKTRVMSPAFTQLDRYPSDADPHGRVLVTAAARDLLRDVDVESGVRGRRAVVMTPAGQVGMTMAGSPSQWLEQAELLGQELLIDELLASARHAVSGGDAALVTLIGDVGLGKSHIASVLRRQVQRLFGAEADALSVRPVEPVAGTQHATTRWLLRQVLQLPDAADGRDVGRALLIDKLGADVASEVYESVGLFLGWLSGGDPRIERLRAAPGALRAGVARALAEGIRRRAKERPQCIVVDDAQWADQATLDALEQATAGPGRVWVCVLARPSLMTVRPDWGERAFRVIHRELQPLAGDPAAELCRRLLRPVDSVPESVIARLVERTGGIPLLLIELVRGLTKQGLLQRASDEEPWQIASEVVESMPETPLVEWIAARELGALADNLSAHARLVSLLAAEFTVEEVRGVLASLERDDDAHDVPLDARAGLEMLVSAGLVARDAGPSSEPENHRFCHGVMRQGVAASCSDAFRSRVHRAAYRYYQDSGSALDGADRRARLAHHAAHAGERARAAAIYTELADEAHARHAYLDADLLYHGALAQLDETAAADRQRVLRGRGVVRCRLARYRDAIDDLSRAREIARSRGDRRAEVQLLMEESTALDWVDEWRRSRELAELARERAIGLNDPALDAWVTMALGRSACRFSDNLGAIALLLEAAERAEGLGDEGYETEVISLMLAGGLLAAEGRLDESQAIFDRGLSRCRERRDDLYLVSMLICRTYLWMARGDTDRLLDDLEQTRALARRLGNASLERHSVINLAWYLHWAGSCEEAEIHARRALEIDEQRLRYEVHRPESRVLVARLRWALGDEAGCRVLVEDVSRQQSWATREGKTEALLVPSEQVMFDMLRFALDDPGARAWDALAARAHTSCQLDPEIAEVLETLAAVASRRGDRDIARSALEDALGKSERLPEAMTERIRRRLAALEPR